MLHGNDVFPHIVKKKRTKELRKSFNDGHEFVNDKIRNQMFKCAYTQCCKKSIGYHPTSIDSFNSSSPIPINFGTFITKWICRKSYGHTNCSYNFVYSKMCSLQRILHFYGLKVFQGKASTVNRWNGKLNHNSMAWIPNITYIRQLSSEAAWVV